jgi:branched-chain amino acid transport system permease protein
MPLGPIIVNGVITGALFALLATALIVLYRATGVLNFAQAEQGTLMVFVAYALWRAGISPVPAVLLMAVASLAFGALLYLVVIRPRAQDAFGLSLRTLGLFILLSAVMEKIWGADAPYRFPNVFPGGEFGVLGQRVTYVQLAAVILTVLLTAAIAALLRFSSIGLTVRAVSSDRETAQWLGVNVATVDVISWALASLLGAVVALLFAMIGSLAPDLMDPFFLTAMAAAMLGGLTSLTGAAIGGLVLGLAQSTTSVYLNQPEWTSIIAFAILLVGVWLTRARLGRVIST